MHPGSKKWYLIDYLLTGKHDTGNFASVRLMRGAECWTTHRLLRAKRNFVTKSKFRENGSISINLRYRQY